MKVYKILLSTLIIFITFFITSCSNKSCDDTINKGVFINEILINNSCISFDSDYGKFSDWIEVYNANPEKINISGWELHAVSSKKKISWIIPSETVIQAKDYLIIRADKRDTLNHACFKLNKSTRILKLVNMGRTEDSLIIPKQQFINISYGRENNGGNKWGYFYTPSPEKCNSSELAVTNFKRNEEPVFSLNAGIYKNPISLEISSKNSNEIRYTIDGSRPNNSSIKYEHPIVINEMTSVRAIVINDYNLPSKIVSNSYFINPIGDLPIVSLTTDKSSLWDAEYGIYENSLIKEKRLANFEYFEKGKRVLNQEINLSIHGNVAKNHPQKAFKISTNKNYDEDFFKHQFFNNKNADSFKSLLLRAGGHADHFYTQFRDELGQHLHVGFTKLDFQGSRPIVLYLNGNFWGIYNLKEKLNADYITSNYGLKKDEFSMLEQAWQEIKTGKRKDYIEMLNFIDSCEKTDENYKKVETLMDVYNFMDYNILQIYVANIDWPNWNIKYWKEDSEYGKWKWIITDLDFGFDEGARVTKNMIEYATSPKQTRSTNPPASTFLLRKLFEFENFKDEFIQRMAVSLNVIYNSDRVVNRIEEEKSWRKEIMPEEIKKWGGKVFKSKWGDFAVVESIKEWEKHIERVRIFARKRPEIIFKNFKKHFNLNSEITVSTSSNDGFVFINSIKLTKVNNSGKYFPGIPLRLSIKEKLGKKFSHWNINGEIFKERNLTVKLESNSIIIAVCN